MIDLTYNATALAYQLSVSLTGFLSYLECITNPVLDSDYYFID